MERVGPSALMNMPSGGSFAIRTAIE